MGDFDAPLLRLGTSSIKWEVPGQIDAAALPGGAAWVAQRDLVLPLGLADMDFRTAPVVVEALQARVAHGIFGYTHPAAEYFAAVIGWLERRHGWRAQRDWIVPTTGAVPAINLAIQMLTRPGDGIIVQPPVFHPFAESIVNNGRRVVCNPLVDTGTRYAMDFDDLAAKASAPGVRMLILCSPHNPVGRVWTAHELCELARICCRNDLLVVSDEVHCDLTHGRERFTTLAVAAPSLLPRLIHCHGPSKTFNLPGLKTSTTIIPDATLRARFVDGLRNLNELFGVHALGGVALQAAYDRGEPWLARLVSALESNRAWLDCFLQSRLPALRLRPAEGTYLAWVDARETGRSSAALQERLRQEARIVVEDGARYGQGGEGFLRINFACPRPLLEAALSRAETTLAHLGPQTR